MYSVVQHSVVTAMQLDEKGLLLLDDIQAHTHFTSEKLKFNENRIYLLAMQKRCIYTHNIYNGAFPLFYSIVFLIITATVIHFIDQTICKQTLNWFVRYAWDFSCSICLLYSFIHVYLRTIQVHWIKANLSKWLVNYATK